MYTIDMKTTEFFLDMPDYRIIFWISESVKRNFDEGKSFDNIAKPRQGLATSDNDRFLRYWFEVNYIKVGFNMTKDNNLKTIGFKWFPYNKGGGFRKWYGNNEWLINWENDGKEIKDYASSL